MAAKTGANTKLGFRLGTTGTSYGTAVACGAGHQLLVNSLTQSVNAEVLRQNPIGSGLVMAKDAAKGFQAPTVSFDMVMGVQNNAQRVLAGFFGSSPAPTEQTAGQGDYLHRLTLSTTLNVVYSTLAFEDTTTTTYEYPSCAITDITITAANPPNYVTLQANLLANKLETGSSTNTNATLANVTVNDSELMVVDHIDDFWLDTQASGALASGDQVNIISYVLNLQKPQQHAREIRGTAGAGEPYATDVSLGTLTVVLQKKENATWDTVAAAETAYKSYFQIEGSTIASGITKQYRFYLPRMKLITPPQYGLAEAGNNPLTLTWELFAADSAPTGMNSVYPYVEVVNTDSAAMIT